MTDSSGGWIKLYRRIHNNPMWQERPFDRARAWVDLILLANHKDGYLRKRGIKIDVKRGQVGWSERALAERWGWSRGKVARFLHELKIEQQIEQQNGPQNINVTSLITITNYDRYQSDEPQNGPQNEPQTGHKQYHRQECKEGKKIKPSSPESLRLSGLLADLILQNNPANTQLSNGKRETTITKWAVDIDKLIRIDGQNVEKVEEVIRWCQANEFWKSNILSGSKLREKWDQLSLKVDSKGVSGTVDDDRYAALRGV